MKRVRLIFLWHMHQPDYYNPESGVIELPWFRLNCCLGYMDMAYHLLRFEKVRAVINFSGCLLEKLRDSGSNILDDRYRKLTLKSPAELSYEEKIFILSHFFSTAERRIKGFQRYWQLYQKRGRNVSEAAIGERVKEFSQEDFMDLQMLFNLSWMGRWAYDNFQQIRQLTKKGRNFTHEDKVLLLSLQDEVCRNVLKSYKRLFDEGRVEISATPFYHPVLPLLIDSDSASTGLPGVELPKRFSYPDDAVYHIRRSVEVYKQIFGSPPSGMWPAEGAVSEETVKISAENGFRWIATDEEILWRSLRTMMPENLSRGELLYGPYRFSNSIIFFRDRYLSDRIGFTYQAMEATRSVEDFISYLEKIPDESALEEPVVMVALDGENPWPHYPASGAKFLDELYSRIESCDWIESTTACEIVDELKEQKVKELSCLYSGSWIDGNFSVWIGDRAKNRAWNLLNFVRKKVSQAGADASSDAMANLYVAEASDWFWWYGEPNSSTEDPIFDRLFRSRLRMALRSANLQIPVELLKPSRSSDGVPNLVRSPLAFIHPDVDGMGEKYFEWYNAGRYDIVGSEPEVRNSAELFSTVYYGFDDQFLYFRLDPVATPSRSIEERVKGVTIRIVVDSDKEKWVEIDLPSPPAVRVNEAERGTEGLKVAFKRVVEVSIPMDIFGIRRGSKIKCIISIFKKSLFVENYPSEGYFEIVIPDENWRKARWIV